MTAPENKPVGDDVLSQRTTRGQIETMVRLRSILTNLERHELMGAMLSILPDILTDEEAVLLGNKLGRIPHERLWKNRNN